MLLFLMCLTAVFLQDSKVVLLEDLASHFEMRTQVRIRKSTSLLMSLMLGRNVVIFSNSHCTQV